ncbi:hypothetical protein [Streptomyces sp. 35G-GA-8]|uniref:hypothetical protein n=1 Tax=Streptomyces sp. 35G-GA-8 TaxID=2939434 RepID=UPI00201F2394|nr:hypothetical protein [Streptomyces sp. 35G-GA-8]MCL7382418.1 hypothetical protein [Streptomyces sp. 35G-GA-8]
MSLDRSTVPHIPEDPAFTVDQLTPADYAAVSAFLAARLRELADSGQTGAARALDEALSLHTDTLGPNFQWETDYRHEPVPDNWLRERMDSWVMTPGGKCSCPKTAVRVSEPRSATGTMLIVLGLDLALSERSGAETAGASTATWRCPTVWLSPPPGGGLPDRQRHRCAAIVCPRDDLMATHDEGTPHRCASS